VELDIRSLILRNESRPLNENSVSQSEILLKMWGDVGQLLRISDRVPDAAIEGAWSAMRTVFASILRLEAAKQSAPKEAG